VSATTTTPDPPEMPCSHSGCDGTMRKYKDPRGQTSTWVCNRNKNHMKLDRIPGTEEEES
jgi:hypothetical protein